MEEVKPKKIAEILMYVLRAVVILLVVFLFVPQVNPARVSTLINENLSLFTSGLVFSQLTDKFGRSLTKGWVDRGTLNVLFFSTMTIVIGIGLIAAAGCMTLGEIKFKKLGLKLSIIGSSVAAVAFAGIFYAYQSFSGSANIKKVGPMIPVGIYVILAFLIACLLLSIVLEVMYPKPDKEAKYEMQPKFQLFLLLVPFIALVFVFSYLPLLGWRFAFFDYKAGQTLTMDKFVGTKWFTYLFQNKQTVSDVVSVLKNTLAISFLNIGVSWLPMAFAIFLTEAKSNRFRRFVQIFTTIPNFISWVLVYAVAFAIFSTDGFVSTFLVQQGVLDHGVNMLTSGSHTWLKMLAWNIWKTLGWNAIIYIAAISSIDQQLYEAATVDGAGRFQRMWHVTVPSLVPTFCVLLLLSIAGILNNGMDQFLVFENSNNTEFIRVLDLYVYDLGIGQGLIPLATVVGMVKSIVSVTLLFTANRISKAIRGESIV